MIHLSQTAHAHLYLLRSTRMDVGGGMELKTQSYMKANTF